LSEFMLSVPSVYTDKSA